MSSLFYLCKDRPEGNVGNLSSLASASYRQWVQTCMVLSIDRNTSYSLGIKLISMQRTSTSSMKAEEGLKRGIGLGWKSAQG